MRQAAKNSVAAHRPLKPRLRFWLRTWLGTVLLQGLVQSLARIFPDTDPPMWNTWWVIPLSVAVVATIHLLGALLIERIWPPRKGQFWDDGNQPGITIRHGRSGAILFHTERTSLTEHDLRSICVNGADLRGEQLHNLDLRGVSFRGANLERASFRNSILEDADFTGCQLGGAVLAQASLRGADLRGADLRGRGSQTLFSAERFTGANFFGARYNSATRWPPGFDPAAHGCAYESDAELALPIPTAEATLTHGNLPVVGGVAATEVAEVGIVRPGRSS